MPTKGAIWGGLVAPVLTYLAVQMNMGFAKPMLVSTVLFLAVVVISVRLWAGDKRQGADRRSRGNQRRGAAGHLIHGATTPPNRALSDPQATYRTVTDIAFACDFGHLAIREAQNGVRDSSGALLASLSPGVTPAPT
jgi:hypothetical protein